MAIVFKPETHSYTSIDPNENIAWTSVTSVISKFKKPFDADTIAAKSAKSKKSKWYGMTPEDIKEAWRLVDTDKPNPFKDLYEKEKWLAECDTQFCKWVVENRSLLWT